MKGEITVKSAVRKASKASKRKGKWANYTEIERRTPKTFKEPIMPLLKYLVKQDKIEKKKNVALWRPYEGGLAGLAGVGVAAGVRGAVAAPVRSSILNSFF